MRDTVTSDVELLSRLRGRLGNHVVDALFDVGTLTKAPLRSDARQLTEALLTWQPALAPSAPATRPPKVEAQQFLADNVPPIIRLLGGDRNDALDASGVALDALARRVYPAFLAASDPNSRDVGWYPMRLRSTSEHAAAVAAVRSETDLAALWTAKTLTTSFAQADRWLQLYDPVELLMHGSWRLCLLRGTWTATAFRQAVRSQLVVLRRASAGEPACVPIFLGFGDARVEQEAADDNFVVRPYRGLLQSWLLSEGDRLDDQGGGFVVEQSLPWTLTIGTAEQDATKSSLALPLDSLDSFTHWADCIAVAIGLAGVTKIKSHQFQAPGSLSSRPSLRWILTADPLFGSVSHHVSQGWPAKQNTQPIVTIDPALLARARELSAIKDEPTRIAIGRLSASLSQLRRWRDGMVDAVIAWEAMSGDCQDAVSLRVSSVIAHLISDRSHRKQVRSEVKKLYGIRSSVLHGGVRKVESIHRDAAVLVGLAALRALVDEYPDLIGKTDRFDRLCLDSP